MSASIRHRPVFSPVRCGLDLGQRALALGGAGPIRAERLALAGRVDLTRSAVLQAHLVERGPSRFEIVIPAAASAGEAALQTAIAMARIALRRGGGPIVANEGEADEDEVLFAAAALLPQPVRRGSLELPDWFVSEGHRRLSPHERLLQREAA